MKQKQLQEKEKQQKIAEEKEAIIMNSYALSLQTVYFGLGKKKEIYS